MIACKICIAKRGLRMSDPNAPLFEAEEELFEHLEAEHHNVVAREGESMEQATERVKRDHPEVLDCEECKAAGTFA